MYNKSNQKYEVLGRFFISENEFCRVKFTHSRHEQIVTAEQVKTGNFTDESILVKKINSEPLVNGISIRPVDVTKPITITELKPLSATMEDQKIQEHIDAIREGLHASAGVPVEVLTEPYIVKPVAIATSPSGEDIEVFNLELFCTEHNLELEAVQLILEGKQKTHRKWRFTQA